MDANDDAAGQCACQTHQRGQPNPTSSPATGCGIHSYMYMISTNARYRFETYMEKTNENQPRPRAIRNVMKENREPGQTHTSQRGARALAN